MEFKGLWNGMECVVVIKQIVLQVQLKNPLYLSEMFICSLRYCFASCLIALLKFKLKMTGGIG